MCLACEGITLRALTLDRQGPKAADFKRSRKEEARYGRQLRQIAKHIDDLTRAIYQPGDTEAASTLESLLRRYSETIAPWAEAVASRMIAEVDARDRETWNRAARQMGDQLRNDLRHSPTGGVVRTRLSEQVTLIKSLPLEAAQRVHELTVEGIANGTRAKEIAAEIMRSGEVSKARATLIARTEVSRTATELTRARALHVGSTHFIWRTVGDSDVRPTHKALNGKVFRWDDPPECDPGHHALPGAIWNCRCYPEPIITD
ncbi:phage head morphogenesis protein [Roseixanthobacter pseudopolyaromaticivorans]|uniref:phage head morphogenesis protein n=1 Tax=Xanthobacteraceae TaxID=335928 RepID=UPI00372AB060